jgi:hypothetical protein
MYPIKFMLSKPASLFICHTRDLNQLETYKLLHIIAVFQPSYNLASEVPTA